jgi:cupin 2 domain-containing protein
MERRVLRGRLEPGAAAPGVGERFTPLVELPGLTIEQILSGNLPEPASFLQAHDEWVLVVEGAARMVVDGDELALAAGDWLLLPAGCPHSVVETRPGTSWLAVHLRPEP